MQSQSTPVRPSGGRPPLLNLRLLRQEVGLGQKTGWALVSSKTGVLKILTCLQVDTVNIQELFYCVDPSSAYLILKCLQAVTIVIPRSVGGYHTSLSRS